VIRHWEDVWAWDFTAELLGAVLRMVCAALPARTGGAVPGEPFDRSTGDDWIADVGPAMSVEVHEEYERYTIGTAANGLTVKVVHEYWSSWNPDRRDSRQRFVRVESFGWGDGVHFRAQIGGMGYVNWQLPEKEHDALFAAWTSFKTAHGLPAT
jgi:hypothetical protein